MDYRWHGVYDADGNPIEAPDMESGTIEAETVTVHHGAVEAVEEVGHEGAVLAEYPNGGRDVEWIVDVPAVEARDAYDEQVEIYRWRPYTADELAEIERKRTEAEQEAANAVTIDDLAAAVAELGAIVAGR